MKTRIVIALMLASKFALSQTWIPGSGTDISTITNDNVFVRGGTIDMSNPTTDAMRYLIGASNNNGIALMSGTANTNGANITMYATGSPTNSGYMGLHTIGSGDFQFWNYNGSSFIPLLKINKDGQTLISDINPALINDRLTVKETIGLMATNDVTGREIHGNTTKGYLGIFSNHGQVDGSSNIELYGHLHSQFPGQAHYNAYGFTGYGHIFQSYGFVSGLPEWHASMGINNNGDVVISDNFPTTPLDRLTVKDNIGFIAATETSGREIHGNTTKGCMGMYSNHGNMDGSAYVEVYGHAHETFPGQVHYVTYGIGDVWGHAFQSSEFVDGQPIWRTKMAITKSGKVAIGENIIASMNIPNDYLLYVEKGILTEHVHVAAKGTESWADFVFDNDYKLPALADVEKYIRKHKHLPEVPSAKDVAKNGIDLAETDAKLLQKIEELTLYVIEQQKRIDKLEAQLKDH